MSYRTRLGLWTIPVAGTVAAVAIITWLLAGSLISASHGQGANTGVLDSYTWGSVRQYQHIGRIQRMVTRGV
jgi:hypothetical protein